MAENSKIEWTDHTFNPWIGCTKVDALCAHCYAEAMMDTRLGRVEWGAGKKRIRTSNQNWNAVRRWNREAGLHQAACLAICILPDRRPRVFCASLADWLDEEVDIELFADLLMLIRECDCLDFLLLTKRPANFWDRAREALAHLKACPIPASIDFGQAETARWLETWMHGTAPENVWFGISVGAGGEDRIGELLTIPARIRFLSCEPMLGEMDISSRIHVFGNYFVDWVICGGESGPGARPMHPDWARSLRDQCAEARVPFLFKQWGEWAPENALPAYAPTIAKHTFADGKKVFRVKGGKSATGRILDGVTHNEFPVS